MVRKLCCLLTFVFIVNTIQAADSIKWITSNLGIVKLTPTVYLIKSFQDAQKDRSIDANHLLVVDQQDIVLINTPWTDLNTHVLLVWVHKEFNRSVSKIIITHSHVDCAGGAGEARKLGISTYGLDKTKRLLMSDSMNISITFHDSLIMKLQTLHLNLYYLGGGHTKDNIVVWIPEHQVLYGGCLVKCNSSVNLGYSKDADVEAWPKTIQKLQEKFTTAKLIIPGHFEYGDTSLFSHTLKLLTHHSK